MTLGFVETDGPMVSIAHERQVVDQVPVVEVLRSERWKLRKLPNIHLTKISGLELPQTE